ncbi:flagellin, partial [Treponema pallidum]
MIINHNMSAMFSQRTLGHTNLSVQKNIEKLSSGLRINRSGDDASGLAVSEK